MAVAKYDQDTRERALRLYYEVVAEDGATNSGAHRKIGGMLDINPANPSRTKTRSLPNYARTITSSKKQTRC